MKQMVCAGLVVGLVLVGAPTPWGSHDPDITDDALKCQLGTSVAIGKFVTSKAKCLIECQQTARKGLTPASDCSPPYADAMLECVQRAETKAESLEQSKCAKDCPECYTGGDCTADAEVRVASVEADVDELGSLVYCDDSLSGDLTAAEAKCQDTVAKTLGKLGKTKLNCYAKCRKAEHRGTAAPGTCLPAIEEKAVACIAKAAMKAAVLIDQKCESWVTPSADKPECYGPFTGMDWAGLVETVWQAELYCDATTSTTTTSTTTTTTTTTTIRTTILMQPDLADGFFSMPWPNDTRRKPDGTIDLTGYPGRSSNVVFDLVLSNGSSQTTGFGTNAAIFMQSSAPLVAWSLPAPEQTVTRDASLLLLNLDDPGAPPAPLQVRFLDAPTTYRPGRLLTALPYPGHPLEEGTRYAAVVFDGVRDANSNALLPAPLLAQLDEPWDAGKPVGPDVWAQLRAQRDEVLDHVQQHTSWGADQVVAFTVFTTQRISPELDAIATAIAALPSPAPLSRGSGDCSAPGTERTTVRGVIGLPRWQAGEYPYELSGGGIVIVDGQAVQQWTEEVDFQMTFPCGAAPAAGWPILLYMDGTGGYANSAYISELGYAMLPYVVASIAPLYSGDRAVPGADAGLLFFNYLNPLAGRTNQLQQAADMIYLRRVVEGIVLSAAETGTGAPVETNDTIVAVVGHSQGALTVPHILAVDPMVDAGFISSGGGGLYHSIIHRKDVRQLVDNLLSTVPGEIDAFHPVIHALQTFAEIGDASNYARRVTDAHVVSTGGRRDGCSPLEVVMHLGTALGLGVVKLYYYHPFFGTASLEPAAIALPVSGNLPGGRTGVTVQLDTGHFGASTNPQIGRTFIESLATGGTPTVDPGPLLYDYVAGCSGRYDLL